MGKIKASCAADGSGKNFLLYLAVCALAAVQPLLDIISSLVINSGRSSFISVSGAVRAVLMLAILVFSLAFYHGRHKKSFSVYLACVCAYISIVCVMVGVRGSAAAFAYMLGLMADTFFFSFAFIMLVEIYYTVGRRIPPAVIASAAVLYALTIAINHLSDGGAEFNFSSAFGVSLAVLIPSALVFFASRIGKNAGLSGGAASSRLLRAVASAVGIALILAGAVLSNSKPVFFVCVIFSALFFIWAFSNWRASSKKSARSVLLPGFAASALFCILVLSLLPVSPVRSSFDGTFNLRDLFYTYSGSANSGTQDDGTIIPPFDDEDDGGGDYVPRLDSGYVPGTGGSNEDGDNNESAADPQSSEQGSTGESATDDHSSEPAGDEPGTEESSDVPQEQTTSRWPIQIPSLDYTDIPGWLSSLPFWTSQVYPSESDSGATVPSDDAQPSQTQPEHSDESEQPLAAIGAGTVRVPPLPAAINMDRVEYYFKLFANGNTETWMIGLRFSSLFDESITPVVRVRSDPFSVFFNYGILGFIAYILPVLFILFSLLKFLLLHFSAVFKSAACVTYMFSAAVIFILSTFDGDVLTFSAAGSMAAVIFSGAFTLCEETQARLEERRTEE